MSQLQHTAAVEVNHGVNVCSEIYEGFRPCLDWMMYFLCYLPVNSGGCPLFLPTSGTAHVETPFSNICHVGAAEGLIAPLTAD